MESNPTNTQVLTLRMFRHFQPKTGHYSCYRCPSGKFQSETGQSSCINCDLSCPKGKHAQTDGPNNTNSSSCGCIDCDKGKFAPTGHFHCYACPAGRFQHEKGHYSCYYCPPGKYSNQSAGECTQCEYEKFTADTSSPECTWCPTGYFQHKRGATECTGKCHER